MARTNISPTDQSATAADGEPVANDGQATAETENGADNTNTNTNTNSETVKAEASEPKTTGTVMVQMPTGLKELIEKKAEEAKVNTAAWIRQLLADTVQYTLPLPAARGRKSKFAGMSAAEAKAAKAQDSQDRQRNIKALLLAARNKDIDIEALLAKYAAEIEIKPRKTAEQKAAEAAETAANAEAEVVTENAAEVPVVSAAD